MSSIYISKSKVGNPDDLAFVRHLLSKLDCEVVEFMGGEYSFAPLLKSEILLVIPPTVGKKRIGRGQYGEIDAFDESPCAYYVKRISNKNITIKNIACVERTNDDWSKDFGEIIPSGTSHTYNSFKEWVNHIEINFLDEGNDPVLATINLM